MSFGYRAKAMRATAIAAIIASAGAALPASAVTIHLVFGNTGRDLQDIPNMVKAWEQKTGNTVKIVPMPSSTTDQFTQYRLWLAAGNSDIDLYFTDVIWAPQLASNFVNLATNAAAEKVAKENVPAIVQSQTVDGKLVALPYFTDAPALYYRKDLLKKYNLPVPKTWPQMAKEAKIIMDGERKAGHKKFWGFVFQGNAYEGLTCDALEWIKSYGGGQIVAPDGKITVNNPKAAAALNEAKSWVGTISPEGVLGYQEEQSRGVWQSGNAAFMRNWPYAYALGEGKDSAVKGKMGVTTLPAGPAAGDTSAATLGGWNIAVSKYSKHQAAAISLAAYLAGPAMQKWRAIHESHLPTIPSVYDDPAVGKAQPIIPAWKNVVLNAVPRPSAPTLSHYEEVSSKFWTAVHNTLSGQGSASDNLAMLEAQLTQIKGGNNWH